MLNPEPVRTAARLQRRFDRLGEAPACVMCGETNPAVLDKVEGHHVVNRVNDPGLTVVLCANCHRAQTETLTAAGVPNRYPEPPTPLERLVAVLAGLATFLLSVGVTLRDWARWLDEFGRHLANHGVDLSDHFPAWTPGVPGGIE
jgi:hypothetical protein